MFLEFAHTTINSVFIAPAGLSRESLPLLYAAQSRVTAQLSRQLQQEGVCQRSFARVQIL
jgi:hypothetical protein